MSVCIIYSWMDRRMGEGERRDLKDLPSIKTAIVSGAFFTLTLSS